jgi:hypothetical protein
MSVGRPMKNAVCPATALHGTATLPFVIPSISTCLRRVEGEMHGKVDVDARTGGPTAKTSAQPGRAGKSIQADPSAVGAALNRAVSLGAKPRDLRQLAR